MTTAFTLMDSDWVRQAFLVSSANLEPVDVQNRTFSTAMYKFVDTTPGGNLSINPPPQFTKTADIRPESKFMTGKGMGRYYSEAIDDNSQRIYMRFGVPQFNSLTTFFTNFYSADAGQLAKTGRSGGIFYSIGLAAGFVVSIISWQVVAIHLAGLALRFAGNSPSSKFYYLKPTMPLYWSAVTTIVNQLAVNRGIVPRVFSDDQSKFNGGLDKFTNNDLVRISNILPDIFKPGGGIDVYAMAGRAQRLARQRLQQLESALSNNPNNLSLDAISQQVQGVMNSPVSDTKKPDYHTYLKSWFNTGASKAAPSGNGQAANSSGATLDQATAASSGAANAPPITSISGDSLESLQQNAEDGNSKPGFVDFFLNELDDGSAFACFRVNSTGHISESFSNSVTESELANKINSQSSTARSTRFDFADGNVSDGLLGKAIGAAAGAVKDIVSGVGAGLQLSGLAALAGSAFVDIPKHWQSSTASLPRSTYSIQLVSPYGNQLSQLINLDIPLAMLLAAALPLATGKQSYTSPFILELYDQGRCQSRLCMFDSLSITRGTANLGFNNDGHAMAIDVSFSIVDMSSIMTMPIAEAFSASSTLAGAVAGGLTMGLVGAVAGAAIGATVGTGSGVFDDDTVFTDYMNVLAGLNLQDQIYQWKKFKLNLTRTLTNVESLTSSAKWAGIIGDLPPSRLISAFYKGRSRPVIPGP